MNRTASQKLPVLQIMGIAYGEVMRNRRAILKGCLIPWAVLWVMSCPLFPAGMRILLLLPEVVAGTMVAVTCHRILLLGPRSLSSEWGLSFGRREARYLWHSVLLGLVSVGVTSGPITLLYLLPAPGLLAPILSSVFILLLAYFMPRIMMLFPATAVDQAWTLRASAAMTNPHRTRLLVLIGLSTLVTSVPLLVLVRFLGLGNPLLLWFLSGAAQLLGVYTIAVLSFAFQFVCPPHLRPVRASEFSDGF